MKMRIAPLQSFAMQVAKRFTESFIPVTNMAEVFQASATIKRDLLSFGILPSIE
jgi:hypothetical protein